jgi:radical SAM-linked protein
VTPPSAEPGASPSAPDAGSSATVAPPPPAPEPRQRWRVAYARRLPATPETAGREYAALWERSLARSGLPLVEVAPGRPKLVFAAPLPLGIAARRELFDVWLTELRTAWQVREAVESVLPPDHKIVDLENVWLGAAALPGRVVGADYLVTLGEEVAAGDLDVAATRLVTARSLPRERAKGTGVKAYDLRPLLGDVAVVARSPAVVRIRTLAVPELGSGRPDEVLAALGDAAGITLEPREMVRERLVLADDAP